MRNSIFRVALWLVAFAIVAVSLWFSNRLVQRLEVEQQRKIEIWAEAMRQFVQADNNDANFDFIWKIIEENDNIPVLIVDAEGRFVTARNFDPPADNVDDYYNRVYERLKTRQEPIEINIDENERQFIYYDDSILLKQLQLFPYVLFAIIAVFIAVVIVALASTKKSEQNRVWVGLSKETAHQLGTPISSLVAWNEMLKAKYPDDNMVNEMGSDVERLKTIAERFSKIGSRPEFTQACVNDVVQASVEYMRRRTSQQVHFAVDDRSKTHALLCVPLFEWVVENLFKNAIDAMGGQGNIDVVIDRNEKGQTIIDVSDTGKGIEKRRFRAVFRPGYTTKQRGWGLGLSLAKRIVEEYHGGRIFVKQSEVGKGTTFRIVLKKMR
ncbi:MAG: HAMP domain-containing sensor histidine kinase [Bacteroidales bacterium]|nr:HAMP domain-containing sensor histidine kinase [Bacteroidales bacterium]MDY6037003.1 HAMP domain-containing sensor histidine kinase [Paludibacteraceae bacterium]